MHKRLCLVLAADLGLGVAELALEDLMGLAGDLDLQVLGWIVDLQGLINLRIGQILIDRGA